MLGHEHVDRVFTGDSFRDLTRIAHINETLWTELFLSNQPHLLNAIQQFKDQLSNIENAIINQDAETLIALLQTSREKRKAFDHDPS